MAWVNRFVVLVLTVLVRMRRWHAVLELGEEWVRLSEGAFNEKVLPLMMQASGGSRFCTTGFWTKTPGCSAGASKRSGCDCRRALSTRNCCHS